VNVCVFGQSIGTYSPISLVKRYCTKYDLRFSFFINLKGWVSGISWSQGMGNYCLQIVEFNWRASEVSETLTEVVTQSIF